MTSKTRRRGARTVCELLSRIERMDETGAKGYRILDDACYAAHFYLKVRAKLQRNPRASLEAAMIVVARQSGLLTEDEWENKLRYLWSDAASRNLAIDSLYQRFMGHKPDRTSAATLQADAAALWACVEVPYTETQLDYLERAWQYQFNKGYKQFTFDERRLYSHQPLDFEKPLPCDRAAGDGDSDRESIREWLEQRLDAREEEHGGRYGYGVRMPRRSVQKDAAPVNPEQVDAPDQASIDAAFAEIMGSVNWGEA